MTQDGEGQGQDEAHKTSSNKELAPAPALKTVSHAELASILKTPSNMEIAPAVKIPSHIELAPGKSPEEQQQKPEYMKKPKGHFVLQERKAAAGEDREGDFVLEEPEILPYDSVFEWDVQDPIGYYRSNSRFVRFMSRFNKDDLKKAVIQGMWRDRIRYQVLRRFTWPPKSYFKIFFSRGYYEDCPSKPTVNVEKIHLRSDTRRREAEAGFKEARKRWIDPKILSRPHTLDEYDPLYYNRNVLVVQGVPEDADMEMLQKSFRNGEIEKSLDPQGKMKLRITFKNESDAEAAYRQGLHIEYARKHIDIEPEKKPPPGVSLSEFDPFLYNRLELVVTGIPINVGVQTIQSFFPMSKIEKIVEEGLDGKGGRKMFVSFNNFDEAKKAYRALSGHDGIGGRKVNVKPKLRVGPGRTLSAADILLFNRKVLVVYGLPAAVDPEWLKKCFPKGEVNIIENPDNLSFKKAIVTFKNQDDAKKAFRKAIAEQLPKPLGGYMLIQPQRWEPRKNSISNFDPKQYNLKTLLLGGFHKAVGKRKLEEKFPDAIDVRWIKYKHALALELEYSSVETAREDFQKALDLDSKGQAITVEPKPNTGPRSLSQFDPSMYDRRILIINKFPGDEKLAKKFMKQHFPKSKILLKTDDTGVFDAIIKLHDEEKARQAFAKASAYRLPNKEYLDISPQRLEPDGYLLDMFDEEEYAREILVISGLPRDTDREALASMFPRANMYYKIINPEGTLSAAAEFPRWEDARVPFRKAAFSEVSGKRPTVLPLRRSVYQRSAIDNGDPQFETAEELLKKKRRRKGGGAEEPPKFELSVINNSKRKALPLPVLSVQKSSLSEFDSKLYNRDILQIRNLPAEADESTLAEIFPKGRVKIHKGSDGGWSADVIFRKYDDARAAFKEAQTAEISGIPLNALPKFRVPKDGTENPTGKDVMEESESDITTIASASVQSLPGSSSKTGIHENKDKGEKERKVKRRRK